MTILGYSNIVTVRAATPPPAPTGQATQALCPGARVSDLSATGLGPKWYAASSGGSPLAGGTSLANGTTYYASQTVGGCESAGRLAVRVSFKSVPAAPAVSDQSFCASASPKVADLRPNGTDVRWYDAGTNRALASTEPLANGRRYYATRTANGCQGAASAAITVTVAPKPAAPTGSASPFCLAPGDPPPTLAAIKGVANADVWYASAGATVPLAPATALVDGTAYYAAHRAVGCESDRLAVRVSVKTDPVAPAVSDQVFCASDGFTVADLRPNGTDVRWYDAGTDRALASTDPLADGGRYYATQTTSGCEGAASAAVTVKVNGIVGKDITTTDRTVCIGGIPDLLVGEDADALKPNSEATISYKWEVGLTGQPGPWSDLGSDDKDYRHTNGIYGGAPSRPYRRTTYSKIGDKTCEAISDLVYVRFHQLNAGSIGSGQTICQGGVPAELESAQGGYSLHGAGYQPRYRWERMSADAGGSWPGTWTDIPGATGASHTPMDPVLEMTRFRRVAYEVADNGQACERFTEPVLVKVEKTPPPTGDALQRDCAVGMLGAAARKLDWLTAAGTDIKWYDGSGNLLDPGTTILQHDTTYYATQTLNGCPSYERLEVRYAKDIEVLSGGHIDIMTYGDNNLSYTACYPEEPNAKPLVAELATGNGDHPIKYKWLLLPINASTPPLYLGDGQDHPGPSVNTDGNYLHDGDKNKYVRRAYYESHRGDECYLESNEFPMTINHIEGGAIQGGDYVFCEGTLVDEIKSAPDADNRGNGSVRYTWHYSTDGGAWSNNINGATVQDYTPSSSGGGVKPPLSPNHTYEFQRRGDNNYGNRLCRFTSANTVKITVREAKHESVATPGLKTCAVLVRKSVVDLGPGPDRPKANSLAESEEELEYTITVDNTWDRPVYGVNITDPILTGTAYKSGTASLVKVDGTDKPNTRPNPDASPLIWTISEIPANKKATVTFKVKVAEDLTNHQDSIYNKVYVTNGNPNDPVKDFPELHEGQYQEVARGNIKVLADSTFTVSKSVVSETGGVPDTARSSDWLEYTITVTNTGDVDLQDIKVTDLVPGGTTFKEFVGANAHLGTKTGNNPGDRIDWTIPLVSYKQPFEVKFRVTVSRDLTGFDKISNTADAVLVRPDNSVVHKATTDEKTILTKHEPGMKVEKRVVSSGPYSLDGNNRIEYEITVENTGNVVLHNVSVTDPLADALTGLNGATNPIAVLGVDDRLAFRAVRTVTQDDVDAGRVDNLARASGTDPNGKPVTAVSVPPTGYTDPCAGGNCPDAVVPCNTCTTVKIEQGTPSVDIKKEQIPTGKTNYAVNEKIEYRITVTNNGKLTLKGLVFNDPTADAPAVPGNWQLASLRPGGEWILTVARTVKQSDLDAGGVLNTAKVTANDPQGKAVPPASDTETVKLDQRLGLKVVKDLVGGPHNGTAYVRDETVRYRITVTNDGNVTLGSIKVVDHNADGRDADGIVKTIPALAPHPQDPPLVFEVTHVVDQSDVDAAEVVNTARARGWSQLGDPADGQSERVAVPVSQGRGGLLEVEKRVTSKSGEAHDYGYKKDETVEYEITVRNGGDLTLYRVGVEDPGADGQPVDIAGGPNPIPVLGRGETRTFRAVRTVVQDDVDAGRVDNLARATGSDPQGRAVTAESTDPDAGLARCAACPLPKTACATCTTVPVDRGEPGITLLKTVTSTGPYGEGDRIEYRITVENSGTLTLRDVRVTDANADAVPGIVGGPNPIPVLAVGDKREFVAYRTVDADDIARGWVDNLAEARGRDPQNGNVTEESTDPDCPACGGTTVPVKDPVTGLAVEKTVVNRADMPFRLGDRIGYEITIRNTGNVALTNVKVEDDRADAPPVGRNGEANPLPALMPGQAIVFVAERTVTADDVARGHVNNLATAGGKDSNGGDVTAESTDPDCPECPETSIPIGEPNPAMEVDKAVVGGPADPDAGYAIGEAIEYMITVRNTGNVTLRNIVLTDARADEENNAPWERTVAVLAPGLSSEPFTAHHTVTQDDVDAGGVLNIARTSAQDPSGNPVTAESRDPGCPGCTGPGTEVKIDQHPGMEVTKSADWERTYLEGDAIDYEIVVRNTGNTTLYNVEVRDDNGVLSATGVDEADNLVPNPVPVLKPGRSVTFTAKHEVTQADIDAVYVHNLALATGDAPNGDDVSEESVPPRGYGDPEDPAYPEDPTSTIVRVGTIPIVAVDDVFPAWTGQDMATGSVLANDTFDGRPATRSGRVALEPGTPDDPVLMQMAADGTIHLGRGLRPGRYAYPYTIRQADYPSNHAGAVAYIDVVDPKAGLYIPNVFTPNGDGVNDTFEILGLDRAGLERVHLLVTNRWGAKLYESGDYRNDWDAEGVPDGTYFYRIGAHRSDGETRVIKGWVTVMRKNHR